MMVVLVMPLLVIMGPGDTALVAIESIRVQLLDYGVGLASHNTFALI